VLTHEPVPQQAPEITARTVGVALSRAGVGQLLSRILWFGSLVVTLGVFSILAGAGTPDVIARTAGVLMGAVVVVAVLLLHRSGPLHEARSLLAAARQRS
jgi:hypothetical protein